MKRTIRLILLGAPGAGKGTQAEKISAEFNIPAISTGAIIREAIAAGTEMGKSAKSYIERGALVPDEVVIGIIKDRLAESDCEGGFILDGFPRTVPQAAALDEMGVSITDVISIEVSDERIIERMGGRRVCKKCGATYHITVHPTKTPGICDSCGSEVVIRKDDAVETVRNRLKIYHETTEVLKSYYAKQDKLALVEGNQPIEDAYHDILRVLGEKV